jgi:dTDP-4-dehydrorhamnose 3,5-epimerase
MTETARRPANLPRVEPCSLPEVLLIAPLKHADARGTFSEVYSEAAFREVGVNCHFVQDNQSLSVHQGTVRGLHFQIPPFAQAKLVRVLRGAIFDVAVDIRSGSATYGRFAAATLSAENGHQFYVPAGFAHGFCTLQPGTEVLYKVDAPYSREHERGLAWNDPEVGISWPQAIDASTLLERDRQYPSLRGLPAFF